MTASEILARVRVTKNITAAEALTARAAVFGGDAIILPDEIETLFAIDEAAARSDPLWVELLAEATVDYLVNQQPPSGYISEANAEWLVERIARDGKVKTETELEVLIKVLDAARSSPPRLAQFALRQVQSAIVDGEGPLAHGGRLERGRVGADEAALLRRILYAFGGDEGIAISRAEAEVLFDINDATADADNDPAWTDLFVKAVANAIMAASGYRAPPRDVALAREEWLDQPGGGVAGFFSRIAAGGLRGVLDSYRAPGADDDWTERAMAKIDAVAASEVISEGEAEWLADRIGRDGRMHDNEKALLRFIGDEAPDIHPALATLITKAA